MLTTRLLSFSLGKSALKETLNPNPYTDFHAHPLLVLGYPVSQQLVLEGAHDTIYSGCSRLTVGVISRAQIVFARNCKPAHAQAPCPLRITAYS